MNDASQTIAATLIGDGMHANGTSSQSASVSSKHQADSRTLVMGLLQRLDFPRFVLQPAQIPSPSNVNSVNETQYVIHEPVQVVTSKELPFWDTLAQFQCEALKLPEMTQSWERALLQEARPVRVANGTIHELPMCKNRKRCVACTYRGPGQNNSLGGFPGRTNPNASPLPLVSLMYPDEISAFAATGDKPADARLCLLCIHQAQQEWIVFVRASLPRVVVDCRLALNLFRYRLDREDGFRSDMMWQPLDQKPLYDGYNRSDTLAVPFYVPRTWRWVSHPTKAGVQVLERANLYYTAPSVTSVETPRNGLTHSLSFTSSNGSSASVALSSSASIASTTAAFSRQTLIPKRFRGMMHASNATSFFNIPLKQSSQMQEVSETEQHSQPTSQASLENIEMKENA